MRKIFLYILPLFFACKQSNNDKQIARVNDVILYESELESALPKEISAEDSLSLVEAFIDNWVREQLLLQRAELNLTDDQTNVEKRIKEYKNSLLIYAYQNQLIKQNLDTIVTPEQVKKYYEENTKNFELKDFILKGFYAKFRLETPDLQKIKNGFFSNKEKEFEKALESCHKYAINFDLDTSKWKYFNDILKEIPINTSDRASYIRNHKNIEVQDTTAIYLFKVTQYDLKDNISPIELEEKRIKNTILNQRKVEFIKQLKKDIYEDAIQKKEVEIFN